MHCLFGKIVVPNINFTIAIVRQDSKAYIECCSTSNLRINLSYQVTCLLVLDRGTQEKQQLQQPLHTFPHRMETKQHML